MRQNLLKTQWFCQNSRENVKKTRFKARKTSNKKTDLAVFLTNKYQKPLELRDTREGGIWTVFQILFVHNIRISNTKCIKKCLQGPMKLISWRLFRCFDRRFGVRCGRCNQFLSPNDLVMRTMGAVFHLHCFMCAVCCRLV